MQQETKICQNCKNSFIIEPDDFDFYKKIKVPAPTFCPACRLMRRMVFRNEHFFYKRKDSRTGEFIFSTISGTAQVKVYETDYWRSDNWNPMDYGRDYDWQRPFFEQFLELAQQVPWFSRSVVDLINSDYSANASHLKNCYLIFNSEGNENCAYGVVVRNSKDCLDNYALYLSELCYQCFMVHNSYRVFFSSHCQNCQDVYFSQDLANCQNCFGCVNLRHKQYHIFNKSYSKDDYLKKLKEFDFGSYKNKEGFQQKTKNFWLQFPKKFMHGIKNVNVDGDYINYSKNVSNSFLLNGGEDCRYCVEVTAAPVKDCYDYYTFGKNAELIYESCQVGLGVSHLKFCLLCYPACRDLQYCLMCQSSSNLFGCVGLRHKQYCICNKQYTKEEYEALIPKIIQHMNEMPYISRKSEILNPKSETNSNVQNSKSKTREIIYRYGEFFPPELSPFCYNETIAQDYFPLTKEQVIEQGYSWKDPEPRNYQIDIKTDELPDHIKDVPDDIIGKVIQCANYRLPTTDYQLHRGIQDNSRRACFLPSDEFTPTPSLPQLPPLCSAQTTKSS